MIKGNYRRLHKNTGDCRRFKLAKSKHKALESNKEFLKLKIRESELEVVQKAKYLGAQMDNSLDWKEHIKTASSKVSKAIGFKKHTESFLPEETHKTLYTGIAEPQLL